MATPAAIEVLVPHSVRVHTPGGIETLEVTGPPARLIEDWSESTRLPDLTLAGGGALRVVTPPDYGGIAGLPVVAPGAFAPTIIVSAMCGQWLRDNPLAYAGAVYSPNVSSEHPLGVVRDERGGIAGAKSLIRWDVGVPPTAAGVRMVSGGAVAVALGTRLWEGVD